MNPKVDVSKTQGRVFAAILYARGWEHSDAAAVCGVSVSNISRYCSCLRRIPPEVWDALCFAVGSNSVNWTNYVEVGYAVVRASRLAAADQVKEEHRQNA